MVNADADVLILALVVATLAYGIFSRKGSNVAGYGEVESSAPKLEKKGATREPATLPGVPQVLLNACNDIIDTFGGTLAGPIAPKRLENDRIRFLISEIVKRMRASNPALDIMCTSVDGGTCDGDASGSEQYELVWIVYERKTNTALQVVSGIIVTDEGRILVTKMAPATALKDNTATHVTSGEILAANAMRFFTPYSLPISPDI